jgi:tripartite-type tricarboxylate transporter receptor subunit TctC
MLLAGLGAISAGRAFGSTSDYPTRQVDVVVPATAGGGADIGARRVGEILQEVFGKPFVIDNRPGASGSTAAAYVARSEKTGYTIGMATDSSVLINPLVMPDVTYKLEDFQLLSPLYMGAMALAVRSDSPIRTLQDYIAESAKHGGLNCSIFGVVSSPRLVVEMFIKESGVKIVPIPYRGENEAIRDLIGGVVPAFFGTTPLLVSQHQAGALRILAVSSPNRLKVFPDVPTFAEAGFPDVVYRWFHGLMLPAGTSDAIIDRLAEKLIPIVASDRFRAGISEDLTPTPMRPADFTAMAIASRTRIASIIRERGLKL